MNPNPFPRSCYIEPFKSRNKEFRLAASALMRALNSEGDDGRGEPWDMVIFDEGAFQRELENNLAGFARARRKLVPSTPNGKGNCYYHLTHPETGRFSGQRIVRMELKDHPDRVPGTPEGDAYIAARKAEMSLVKFRQEYLIDYDVFVGEGLLSHDWNPKSVDATLEWDGDATILIGMDFGFMHPAVTWSYVNEVNQWCDIDVALKSKMDTEEFCTWAFERTKDRYPGCVVAIAPDPFGGRQNRSIKNVHGENKELDIMLRVARAVFGSSVRVEYRKILEAMRKDRHSVIRNQMRDRADGRPGLLVHPRCSLLIEAFQGAYRLPDEPTARQVELEDPEPNDYRHVIDARGYSAIEFMVQRSVAQYVEVNPGMAMALAARARERAIARRMERGL